MDDRSLMELLRHDPERGFCELTRLYSGLVYAVVRGKLAGVSPEADIEDCAAEAFSEFYRTSDSFDAQRGSIRALLAAIARRRAVNLYRKTIREKAIRSYSEADDRADDSPSPAENAEQAEERRTLLEEVKALGEPDREIIIRKYYLAESTKSIAKRLGMKPSAVDTRAHRAVLRLKNKLGGNDEN